MISYRQFLENKEKDEERNGLDFDHDNERGESKEHQKKVAAAKKEMLEFFQARKEGAAEIASKAKTKGGPSMLTYWHFHAKAIPYNEVISAIRNDKSEQFFLSKCRSLLHSVKCGSMSQQNFQVAMGRLEVWGEAWAKLFGK